jgi:hypothetical protein
LHEKFRQPIHPVVVLLAAVTVFLLLVGTFLFVIRQALAPPTFTLDYIEQTINDPLPTDAQHIQYDGKVGRNRTIRLTFSASPASASTFISRLCNGVLHPGYDPFNAVDSTVSTSGFVIDMGDNYYYSSSPNTPLTRFGNRCWDNEIGIIQVLLDKSDASQYYVTVDLPGICNDANPPLPCDGIYK